jgi:hypothetical protein
MLIDVLRLPVAPNRIAPVESHLAPLFCLALLTASCALASFALARATPFAAFAVLAAAMLPLSSALLVVGAAWIVNQAIGFGALAYPVDMNTVLWGIAIGAAAMLATVASALMLRRLARTSHSIAISLALVAAYATYEIVLFAFTPALGGAGAFTVAIVGRLAALNILWTIGLLAVCAITSFLRPLRRGHAPS